MIFNVCDRLAFRYQSEVTRAVVDSSQQAALVAGVVKATVPREENRACEISHSRQLWSISLYDRRFVS